MTPAATELEMVLESFGHKLVVALINSELHAPDSQLCRDNLSRVVADIERAFELGAAEPLVLRVGTQHMHVGGHKLIGASLQAGKLLRLAAERGVREVAFHRGLDAVEFGRFMTFLTAPEHVDAFQHGVLTRAADQNGLRHVRIALCEPDRDPVSESDDDVSAIKEYQALAEVIQENHVHAFRGEGLEINRAAGIVEQAMVQIGKTPSQLLALANYDDIDSFTVGHSVRVALLALQVAHMAGAGPEDLLRLGTAGLLHDVGKSRVPQEILFKQGKLDDEEWALMVQHPRFGAEILLEQKDLDPSAIGATFCHHMTPEGAGYPKPALPFEPSGVSKLVRVCDVFEALTAVRPYKKALTPVEAHAIMHKDRHTFDPDWLEFFVQVIGIYPLGTQLRLQTGEVAVVEQHGTSCDQPVVRLLTGPEGGPRAAGEPDLVTIGRRHEGVEYLIEQVLAGHHRALQLDDEDLGRVIAPHPCT